MVHATSLGQDMESGPGCIRASMWHMLPLWQWVPATETPLRAGFSKFPHSYFRVGTPTFFVSRVETHEKGIWTIGGPKPRLSMCFYGWRLRTSYCWCALSMCFYGWRFRTFYFSCALVMCFSGYMNTRRSSTYIHRNTWKGNMNNQTS